ncbi:unnamed protein product [Clonostachys rosea]|uniref:Uncharacterized protein n=1 Tax=Bionectria ochroleuca TaxID=29856 RepID=A0ABY6TPE6_BIOOC|nr:unnamed protein product [Clonostachys rosea]
MRHFPSPSHKRRRLGECQAPRSNSDTKIRQQERDRDHLEQDQKHTYVHSWIQTLPSQPSLDSGLLEADQDIEEVDRWKPHNLPLRKYGSHYGNKLDQNRSSWVLRDNPLQSPPCPQGNPQDNGNGSSGSSSASASSSVRTDHQDSESQKENMYRKRPRAKTRLERYDSKKRPSHTSQNKHRSSRKRKSGTNRRDQSEEKSSKMCNSGSQALRPRKDIMNNYTSSAIPSTIPRVTLKPNFKAGLFTNGRGPFSSHNTEPVDLESPIDKSSTPMIHSDNFETVVPENGQDVEKNVIHAHPRTRDRRREYFDEAEDFFAHGRLDYETPVNVKEVMPAQAKEVHLTSAAFRDQNMQEGSDKGDLEDRALKRKACLQPGNSEMRDGLERNTGPDLPVPIVSRTEVVANSPESDQSSIPTPILRRLFQTGVFSHQNAFVKDRRETCAAEREEISHGSCLDGLDNNRKLEADQFLAYAEELKHGAEPEYSVPGLHEQLRRMFQSKLNLPE